MCTKHRELFASLAAPSRATKSRLGLRAGASFSYVTARTVMNRLDAVLGPENWWDDYTPLQNSVICRLSIRLPDGSVVVKSDAGGYAGMADQGDDDKSGFSDAFKRVAVKFGVGRYLYRDGVANLTEVPKAIAGPAVGAQASVGRGSPDPAPPSTVRSPAPTPAPAEKPKTNKKPPEIKTGYQLYQYASKCKIDPRLVAWINATFEDHPVKISTWSNDQVARALPRIRVHLEEVMSQNAKHAA